MEITQVMVDIVNGSFGESLYLSTSPPAGIALSGNGTTQLILTGNGSPMQFTEALQDLRYMLENVEPLCPLIRTINITVTTVK